MDAANKKADRIKVAKYTGVYYRESKKTYRGRPEKIYEITYKDVAGRMIRHKVGSESQGVNAQYAANYRAEEIRKNRMGETTIKETIDNKKNEMNTNEAFGLWLDQWAIPRNLKNIDSKIIPTYNKHIAPVFGNKLLSDISPSEIKQWLSTKTNFAESYRRQLLQLLNTIYEVSIFHCDVSNYKGDNPCKKIPKPKPSKQRMRFLNYEEATMLLNYLHETNIKLFFAAKIGLDTGMRLGEIIAMRPCDIDYDNGLIVIPQAKGGDFQKVYLTNDLIKILPNIPYVNEHEPLLGIKNISHISHLFTVSCDKLGLNDNKPKLERVCFHTLRHTFCSWLAMSGRVSVFELMTMARHKSVTMTMRYTHLMPDDSRRIGAQIMSEIHKRGNVTGRENDL